MERTEIFIKDDLLAFLKSGDKDIKKNYLVASKRLSYKEADGLPFFHTIVDAKGQAVKANLPLMQIPDEYKIRAIINTTNIMDSHMDVHFPGLWDKSLSENKMLLHVQEHNMQFDKIISSDELLKAYTKNYTWREIGYKYPGFTEALVFDSTIKQAGKPPRNPFMYDQYSKGYVKNHSVGMQYIKMILCINEPDDLYYGAEYEAWQKYFPEVVNQDYAEEKGFFWGIMEAKAIEGSAVPIGSNRATPTFDNNLKQEPGDHSEKNEPQEALIDYKFLTKHFSF